MLKMAGNRELTVQSSIGKRELDRGGSAIGAARMDPGQAYRAIPPLLKEYIDTGSENNWIKIRQIIDSLYITVSAAMEALDAAAPFSQEVTRALEAGKKLLFKPNLVMLPSLDFQTHGSRLYGCCLPWEFLAPVMRWFHDRLGISYHQMTMGEAGTATSLAAIEAAKVWGINNVTTLAVMEGRLGKHYGGWGFYFARKYLAESHPPEHIDDPLQGYGESISGVCLPPGQVQDKLLVYDLNKISSDCSNGREVPVADGINYQTITLHKAIIGGDPQDPEDIRDWPGCYLINVAKLKIHVLELFTCAVKNLGIGLYPMEANDSQEPGEYHWKYAIPHLHIPMFKMGVPHSRWIVKTDIETGNPVREKDGGYSWTRSGGMQASMADAIQAVKGQDVPMLHIADAIEAVNINHSGPGCQSIPEGFVFVSQDMVALDTCVSRYLFTMVPMAEANRILQEHNLTSDAIQKVPVPKIEGLNIVNGEGYDSAFSRYGALNHCESRGIGQQKYHVVGQDLWQGGSLASLNQHLGRVENGVFSELVTTTLYHTPNKPLHDLQATCLAYLAADDKLTGSNFRQKFQVIFDENEDGIIDYLETGRSEAMLMGSYTFILNTQDIAPMEASKLRFLISTGQLKRIRQEWNTNGHDIGGQAILTQSLAMAFSMSQAKTEQPDPFFPGRIWGKGKWPSLQLAMHRQLASRMFGSNFPDIFDVMQAPYGQAFSYADARWNAGKYTFSSAGTENHDVINNYHQELAAGADLLPFDFYVPRGFGKRFDKPMPNVKETDDPQLLFTAMFDGQEVWGDLKLSSFNLK